MKNLSFIILTYNSENDIKDCLDSLLKNFDSKNAEIIIWDNNSKDKTKEILNIYKNYNFIKIIFAEKNFGFADGNNLASKYANGKYLVLLNADTISDYKVFEKIAKYLENNLDVGIVGPKCVDEIGVIQESYGNYPSLLKEIRGKFLMSLYLEKIKFIKNWKNKFLNKKSPLIVGWIGGACAIIRKDLWDKLKGLDSTYFFSNGDMIDFCYKAKNLGYKVIYYPLVSIIHKGSRSVTKNFQSRIIGLKSGYLGTLYFFSQHNKSLVYIYFVKFCFIFISLTKGIIGILLIPFNKEFKDLALSHFYAALFLFKNFFNNNFKKLCLQR